VQRPKDGSGVTGFGSFDNSTCKRVLDLLEPGDLTLGQVAVVKLGVNSQSGDGGWKLFWCRGIDGYSEGGEYGNSNIWRQMRSS